MQISETGEESPPSRFHLKREMDLWMAIALAVGNMVRSGIFLLPSSLAAAAGPVSIIGWIFPDAGAVREGRAGTRVLGDDGGTVVSFDLHQAIR